MRSFGIQLWSVMMTVSTAMAQDFEPITTEVPQDTTSVSLPPGCPSTTNKIPNTMWTFAPSDGNETNVLTTPADLVTVDKGPSGQLRITWNPDAFGSSGHGVRIEFPADQLEGLVVQSSSQAQVLDGFTNLQSIDVGSSAKFWGTMSTLANTTSLSVKSTSSGKAYVKAPGAMVSRAEANSSGNLDLEAGTIQNIQCSSSGKLNVKGNVANGGVSSSGSAVVDGDVAGNVGVSSSGKLGITGEITGNIEASSSGKVESATSCDNVSTSSSGSCSVKDVNGVTVDVTEQPSTRTGTSRCGGSGASSILGAGSFLKSTMISVAFGMLLQLS